MEQDMGTAMRWGTMLGVAIAVLALLAATTGFHFALGIESIVDFVVATPLMNAPGLQGAGIIVQWMVVVAWFAVLGAAFGHCLHEGTDGWFVALVLAVAVVAGHAA